MTLRLPKAELPPELADAMITQLGAVPESVEVMWNSPPVAEDNVGFGARVGAWDDAPADLKSYAHMAVAAQVGCSWCLDVGYFQAQNEHLDLAKASQVPRWRDADVFTDLERDVMGYAEAMTETPPTVTDEMYGHLLAQLGPAAMAELTAYVGFANCASRANVANGVESQGFSATCEVPLAEPVRTAGTTA